MSNWFLRILAWILNLWSSLPESTKARIIDAIVEGFTELFKAYYRSANKEDGEKNE